MNPREKLIDQLIQSLYDFLQNNGGVVKSESFENITISINQNIEALQKLKKLFEVFREVDNRTSFLEDTSNNSIDIEEIQENIDTGYIDFFWQIRLHKLNWFKIGDQTVSVFFDKETFINWLNEIEVFDRNQEILKYEKIQIVLPMYEGEDIIGKYFLITNELKESWTPDLSILLPDDTKIKEFVHLISSDSIIFNPEKFVLQLKENANTYERILQTKYAEALMATLVQIFSSKDNITIRGLKHFQTQLNNNEMPDIKVVSVLEKAVVWAYEENTNTRLQLLADRLSFHEHNSASLMGIVIKHIEEAFTEAKDRYMFVVSEKSEEYTKDLRDLLKDTKDKTDKYSEKTRSVINSLLRDTLGSIFFLGLTAYARFSGNHEFIFSEDAQIVFLLLGAYFLLSMVLQAIFNFWDIGLSQKEAHKWSESSMDYMTREAYDKYVTRPLSVRTYQFIVVQVAIIVVYLCLALLSFNIQSVSTYLIGVSNDRDPHKIDISSAIPRTTQEKKTVNEIPVEKKSIKTN